MGLDVNTFDGVDEEEGTVAEARRRGHFAAEIDVAGGIDEVHEYVGVAKENRGTLHCDCATLFFIEVVHEPDAPGEFGVDNAAARSSDEVVGEGGLAVVDVGEDADVADSFSLAIGTSLLHF